MRLNEFAQLRTSDLIEHTGRPLLSVVGGKAGEEDEDVAERRSVPDHSPHERRVKSASARRFYTGSSATDRNRVAGFHPQPSAQGWRCRQRFQGVQTGQVRILLRSCWKTPQRKNYKSWHQKEHTEDRLLTHPQFF